MDCPPVVYEQLYNFPFTSNAVRDAVRAYIEAKYEEHRRRLDHINAQREGALISKDYEKVNQKMDEISGWGSFHPLDHISPDEIESIGTAIHAIADLIIEEGKKQ